MEPGAHLLVYSLIHLLSSSYPGPDTVLGTRDTTYKRKSRTRSFSAFADGGEKDKEEANKQIIITNNY